MPDHHTALALVPRPHSVVPLPGSFVLDRHTGLRADPGAEGAADLLRALLAPATGLPLAPRSDGRLALRLDPSADDGDEGYRLTVTADGVLLSAARPDGLLRGVQTLRQLLPPRPSPRRPGGAPTGRCPAYGSPTGPGSPGAGPCSTWPATSSPCRTYAASWTCSPCTN